MYEGSPDRLGQPATYLELALRARAALVNFTLKAWGLSRVVTVSRRGL